MKNSGPGTIYRRQGLPRLFALRTAVPDMTQRRSAFCTQLLSTTSGAGVNRAIPGAFLSFSPRGQAAIVEEAHRAGLTAQAHSLSVEGLRIAIEAGCNLITHCNVTGPVPIPESTLEL